MADGPMSDRSPLLVNRDEEEEEELKMGEYPNISPACCTCLPFDIYPFLVLGCICMLTFGSYWVYDTPGAIQTQLTFWFGGPSDYSNTMNSLLYSVYGLPNCFLAFFGGIIMDRWLGVRWGGVLTAFLIFLGQTVFALGVVGRAYPWCVAGRFIFGLGGESLTVAQNTFTTRWFDGEQLALAFGLVLAFSRIGSAINFVVTPILASMGTPFHEIGVPLSVWFGTFLCFMSLCFAASCSLLDYSGRSRLKRASENSDEPPVNLADVKEFPLPAWILMLICGFFYVAVLTFYTVASLIMQHTGHEYPANIASAFIAIPNLVSIIGAPGFGKLVDKFGRALVFLIAASLTLCLGHVLMLGNALEWWVINPIPIFIVIGIAYSAGASSIWPILSYIIPTKMISTAYGTMTSIQNTFLTIFPLITSAILTALHDSKGGFAMTIAIFVACALVAAGLSLLLIGLDLKYTEGRLNMSGADRRALRQREAETDPDSAAKLEHLPVTAAGAAALISFVEEAQVVHLQKSTQQIRRGFLSKLGIQPAPIRPMYQV